MDAATGTKGMRRKDKPIPGWQHTIRSIVTLLVTGFILQKADVLGVMLRSRKLNHSFLYVSYFLYGIFFVLQIYVQFVLSPRNPRWDETNLELVYTATGAVVGGGLCWTIGVWPVFHFWTFPLGLAAIFFGLSVLDFIPGNRRRKDDAVKGRD